MLSAKKTTKQDQPEATLDAETPMVALCNVRVVSYQDVKNSESFGSPVQVIRDHAQVSNSGQSFYPTRVAGESRFALCSDT